MLKALSASFSDGGAWYLPAESLKIHLPTWPASRAMSRRTSCLSATPRSRADCFHSPLPRRTMARSSRATTVSFFHSFGRSRLSLTLRNLLRTFSLAVRLPVWAASRASWVFSE